MDDTTFREILRAIDEEAVADPSRKDFALAAANITGNMLARAKQFSAQPYPYGSEFAFDTTGQEAVVVWLLYFATATNGFAADAKRTVDHILSYMRSSATWPTTVGAGYGATWATTANGKPLPPCICSGTLMGVASFFP